MKDPVLKTQARDLRTDLDLHTSELTYLLDLAARVKRNPGKYINALKSRYLTLLFEKPSLRTRLTFELAIKQLGGDSVSSIGPIGDREPVKDIARNLDRWTQGIVARVYSQKTIDDLAQWSSVPVINALSDLYHPCQALADMLTMQEHLGDLRGRKLAFVGDGNNVAHSLLLCGVRLGMHVAIAAPSGYLPKAAIVEQARAFANSTGSEITVTSDPQDAVRNAHAIYTDVWASMGQEGEASVRGQIFAPYQVNESLMAAAGENALFMHCLPAKRGQETTDAVAECRTSVIFDQAENRLHAQKALLLMLVE